MMDRLRLAIVPAYLLACLLFGGSAQGVWTNAGLQLLAIPIIAWAIVARGPSTATRSTKSLALISGLALLLIAVQLIPLPPGIWTSLPGRGFVVEGFWLLGMAPPWLPISLTPHDSMATALTLLPPLAVLSAMLWTGAYRASWIVMTIVAAGFTAVLVGALQVSSANPAASPWYFYRRTNHGFATGFFANSNHMAAMLMICVPMVVALAIDWRNSLVNSPRKASAGPAILMFLAAATAVFLLGVALGGSLAVLLLGPPVLIMSSTLLLPRRKKLRTILPAAAVLTALAILPFQFSSLHDRLTPGTETSVEVRRAMWSRTIDAIPDFMPLGSGLSSFRKVYAGYEDRSAITREFTSHAHNDYLELALELGVPGILLIIAFLIWWGRRTRTIWLSPSPDPYAQAATIATAALLLHSLVEFPLRTAALSAVMAALLAIMARPREPAPDANADLWPTRHARI